MKKRGLAILIITLFCFFLSACSAFTRQDADDESGIQTNEMKAFKDMQELESGGYYVLHKGEYYPLYIGDTSFNTSSSSNTSDDRTCWFQKDFELVPTLYEGDKLIYCNDEYIDEKFDFERFEYMGYTVGICNLERRESGRYAFSANTEDKKNQIAVNSDASKLYELKNSTAVIETISGKKLPPGNISRGGTIRGLTKDQKYKVQIYVGTQMYEYSLIADSVALTSMEDYHSTDYTFMESRIAEINIPAFFKAGYYTINGSGMFRLVRGRSYNKHTDFNVANITPTPGTDSSAPADDSSGGTDNKEKQESLRSEISDTQVKRFTLSKERKVIAKITWKDKQTDVITAAPTAKIIGENAAYTFSRVEGTNTLSIVKTLPAGTYRIMIDGLQGREYEIEVK